MTITLNVYKELAGLYVNIMVANKYKLSEYELMNIREKNAQFAKQLDALNVPWIIQNQVAHAGEKSENWQRYNRQVITEIIDRYNT